MCGEEIQFTAIYDEPHSPARAAFVSINPRLFLGDGDAAPKRSGGGNGADNKTRLRGSIELSLFGGAGGLRYGRKKIMSSGNPT